MSKNKNTYLAKQIVAWYQINGRKDLPWRKNISVYKVWISEIMLQQTQVATVIPYFKRFIKEYPSLRSLIKASEDDILALWSGLGFYRRAKNLFLAQTQSICLFFISAGTVFMKLELLFLVNIFLLI